MTVKTQMRDHTEADLTENEAESFFESLEEFRQTLTPREQELLGTMVVVAAEGEESLPGTGQDGDEPSEAEVEAFADKLNQFHDTLGGNQHVYLDALVGKSFLKDERADVEGYHWLDVRWIPVGQTYTYRQACGAAGGDSVRIFRRWRAPNGVVWRRVGCWEADY